MPGLNKGGGVTVSIGHGCVNHNRFLLDCWFVRAVQWVEIPLIWVQPPLIAFTIKSLLLTVLLIGASLVFADELVLATLILITITLVIVSLVIGPDEAHRQSSISTTEAGE